MQFIFIDKKLYTGDVAVFTEANICVNKVKEIKSTIDFLLYLQMRRTVILPKLRNKNVRYLFRSCCGKTPEA